MPAAIAIPRAVPKGRRRTRGRPFEVADCAADAEAVSPPGSALCH